MAPSLLAAALAPREVCVELAGRVWRIPPRPAAAWIPACLDAHLESAVLPGLLEEQDAARLADAAMAGRVQQADWRRAVTGALAEAGGRDWWQVIRLVTAANDGLGRLAGELTLHGVDARRVSLAGWCAAVYALLVRGLDEKQLLKVNTRLTLVPEGLDEQDAPADADQIRALLAVMPQFEQNQ